MINLLNNPNNYASNNVPVPFEQSEDASPFHVAIPCRGDVCTLKGLFKGKLSFGFQGYN